VSNFLQLKIVKSISLLKNDSLLALALFNFVELVSEIPFQWLPLNNGKFEKRAVPFWHHDTQHIDTHLNKTQHNKKMQLSA
jgi:hypothetical protein